MSAEDQPNQDSIVGPPEQPTESALGPIAPPLPAELVFGERLALAVRYWQSLAEVATVRGLIGPREVDRLWDRHILNCAVIGDHIEQGARVVDIGSGAGLPGIPLALARPDLRIALVEPLLRRSTYLTEVVALLGIEVEVHRGRAEDVSTVKAVGDADVVTSRAVAPLGKLAGWSLPLLKPGGSMLAMKGTSAEEEIQRDRHLLRRAGGRNPRILTAGQDVLAEPTLLVALDRKTS